jgi:sec-independent protein translocase protein TatC
MPRSTQDEDIFQDSTMTFGEHLEELRVCLFRSVAGLIGGLVIGLCVGGYVVEFIQMPLTNALKQYYKKTTRNSVEKDLGGKSGDERSSPYSDPKQLDHLINSDELLAEKVYIDPVAFLDQLKFLYPDRFESMDLPRHVPENEFPEEKDGIRRLRESDLIHLFLWRPAQNDSRISAKALGVHEGFMIYLKASLLVGAIVASPWIFYQIWMFVAAGLYPHEKRYVNIYLPFSVLLFLLGVSVAFFFVFKPVLDFLFTFNRYLGISPEPRISEWLGFVLLLPLAFGITFQLPLVMLFLERVGVFTVRMYLSYWRVAVLVIFVLAAIFCPPDPFSMLFLAGPLTFLYFGGILLCRVMPKGKSLLPAEE